MSRLTSERDRVATTARKARAADDTLRKIAGYSQQAATPTHPDHAYAQAVLTNCRHFRKGWKGSTAELLAYSEKLARAELATEATLRDCEEM